MLSKYTIGRRGDSGVIGGLSEDRFLERFYGCYIGATATEDVILRAKVFIGPKNLLLLLGDGKLKEKADPSLLSG